MNFDQLNIGNALKNALDDMGFISANEIQYNSFAKIMSGRDVVGVSPTGSGKTLAFLLPVLRRYQYSSSNAPKIVILVPTRELVNQIVSLLNDLCKYMTIRIHGVYGGVNIRTQSDQLSDGVDLLVATPGRLIDLALNRIIRFKKLNHLIIDEVDEMLHLGFRPQLNQLFELMTKPKQHILFSATMNSDIEEMVRTHFNDPLRIEVKQVGSLPDGLSLERYLVDNDTTKLHLLQWLLSKSTDQKILIFAPDKRFADLIYQRLTEHNDVPLGIIHSNKSQNYRNRTIEQFESGHTKRLVATDLVARGIDFKDIDTIISFDTPNSVETFIHRVGRTARNDKKGNAILLVNTVTFTEEVKRYKIIESNIDKNFIEIDLPDEITKTDLLMPHEIETYRQKNIDLSQKIIEQSQGAFHDKKLKNTKVNRAQERRKERLEEKKRAKRKPKK